MNMNSAKKAEVIKSPVAKTAEPRFAPEYQERGHGPLDAEDRDFIKLHDQALGTFTQIAEYKGWFKNKKPNRNRAASHWNTVTSKGHVFLTKEQRDILRSYRELFKSKAAVDAYFTKHIGDIDETTRHLFENGHRFFSHSTDFPNARAPKAIKLIDTKSVMIPESLPQMPTALPDPAAANLQNLALDVGRETAPVVEPKVTENEILATPASETPVEPIPEVVEPPVIEGDFVEKMDAAVDSDGDSAASEDHQDESEGGNEPSVVENADDEADEAETDKPVMDMAEHADVPQSFGRKQTLNFDGNVQRSRPTSSGRRRIGNLDATLARLGISSNSLERIGQKPAPELSVVDEGDVSKEIRKTAAELLRNIRNDKNQSPEIMADKLTAEQKAMNVKDPLPRDIWQQIEQMRIAKKEMLERAFDIVSHAYALRANTGRGMEASKLMAALAKNTL